MNVKSKETLTRGLLLRRGLAGSPRGVDGLLWQLVQLETKHIRKSVIIIKN